MGTFSGPNRRWWALVGTCMGLFLLMLDSTVVTLALPAIQTDLDASTAENQWLINGYLLAICALIVTVGRLGDQFGRRRLFIGSMLIFLVGSVISALSPTPEVLIGGRVVQGVAAAGMMALSLALVSNVFPAKERPRALGIWAAVSAIALSLGPILGGLLIDELSWRWIFWINVPFIALGVILTRLSADEVRDESASARIDVPGFLTLTAGLVALVLGLIQSPDWGWGSPLTLGTIALGLVLLGAFWVVEHRVDNPIVDFALFRNRPYLGANAAAFGIVAVWWTLTFFQPTYLQEMLGYSPFVAGVLFLPVVLPMLVLSPMTGWLIERLGMRAVMTTGMALSVVGLVWLTQVDVSSDYGTVLPGYLILGLAIALVYAPMSTAAMSAMPPSKAGIAAGVLGQNRLMAGALGLAVIGALFHSLAQEEVTSEASASGVPLGDDEASELDGLLADAPSAKAVAAKLPPDAQASLETAAREAYTFALANSTWVLVGIAVVTTILTWLLVRPVAVEEPAVEAPAAEEPAAERPAVEAPATPRARAGAARQPAITTGSTNRTRRCRRGRTCSICPVGAARSAPARRRALAAGVSPAAWAARLQPVACTACSRSVSLPLDTAWMHCVCTPASVRLRSPS